MIENRYAALIADRTGTPGLTPYDDGLQKEWILVTYGNEASKGFHLFCFPFVCQLVWHNLGTNLPLTQIFVDDGAHRVFANAQFLCHQESVANLVPAFVALARSRLGFCLSTANLSVAHPQSFPSCRKSV